MAKKKISDFYQMTQGFFPVYLPGQRNSSEHTIRAYQKSVDQLAEFVAECRNVSLWDVDFQLIDSTVIVDFLDSLEESGNSVATRNQRLKGTPAKGQQKTDFAHPCGRGCRNPQALLLAHIRRGRRQSIGCPRPCYLRSVGKNDLSI